MTWSQPAFERLAALLGARTGLVFIPDRRVGAELGVRRAMARAGVADPELYRTMVAGNEAMLDDLLVELTVGETYFYREPAHFEFVRRVIAPKFRASGESIRAWSAGCASGEEAYTLAMVFLDEGLADRARVLATDVCRAALARAKGAEYGPWSLRGEGETAPLPHLSPRDDRRFRVDEPVRRLVRFEHLNLAMDVYPSFATGTIRTDLIFCRNVLIYFDRETIRAVAGRLAASLSAEGWLITASSDPPLGLESGLSPVITDFGVFYQKAREKSVVSAGFEIPAAVDASGPLASARDDLAEGRFARAVAESGSRDDDPEASAVNVRALANLDLKAAARACAEAAARHPCSAELHYLHAVLLMGLDRDDEAEAEARRVVYLDRTLAVGHYLLGSVALRREDRAGARRSFRNARDLCEALPADEVLALSDGEPAGRLAEQARLQLDRLDAAERVAP